MSNPLNDVPFDINTLRADDEFNWDCVDGIDQIHKDILKAWERIIIAATTPLNNVNASLIGIGNNIVDYAAKSLPSVQSSIASVDSKITGQLSNAVAPLVTKYGSSQDTGSYYLVWRQRYCNQWYPAIEQWVNPPSDRTHYGPYKSSCALVAACCSGIGLLPGQTTMPLFDSVFRNNLDTSYNTAVSLGWNNDANCDPTHNCGMEIGTRMLEMEAALNCTYPSPVTPIVQPAFPYPSANGISCEEFLQQTWVYHNERIVGDDNTLFTQADLPLIYDGLGRYLTTSQHADYLSRCQRPVSIPQTQGTTDEGIPTPNSGPSSPSVPTSVNVPINQTPNPTIDFSPVINVPAQQGFTPQCCDALVRSLAAIASAISGRPISEFGKDLGIGDCGTMLDDKYLLTECSEKDESVYLDRLNGIKNGSLPKPEIYQRIDDIATFIKTPIKNTNSPLKGDK